MSPQIILNPHKYSHIYLTQIFSMLLGLHKYSVHKPINCLGPSHKYYPLYPTYYPTRIFHKNTHHVTTKIGPQNYAIPTKKIPSSFTLWAKPKKKAQQYHLLSPLLHGTLKPIATWQYFTKSQNHFYKAQILIWHLFLQSPNTNLALFYKA